MKTIATLISSVNTAFAAIKAAFSAGAARFSETSFERDRREMEAFLAGSGSLYELEARQRQWDARSKRNEFFNVA